MRIGDRTFTYDASGNQTGFEDTQSHTRRVIVWDEENRIDSLSDNGRTHLYSYDEAGERSIKDADHQGITAYVSQYYTMRNASLGTKHVFVGTTRMASKLTGGMTYLRGKSGKPTTPVPPPGGEPTGPGQGTLHRSPQAAAHAQNTLKNPHYADPSLPLTVAQENAQLDNPVYADWEYAFPESYDVATIGGGSEHLYFYHADHLGSTGYVTREDAALVEHVQYFPFGETWVQQSGNSEKYPYLFTSKELDEETGLYYFGARYYDPRTSVWQSVDPILDEYLPNRLDAKQQGEDWKPERDLKGRGGVFNPANLLAYTHGNPVIYKDPDGRFIWFLPVVLAAGAYAADALFSPDIGNAPGEGDTPLANPSAGEHFASMGIGAVTAGVLLEGPAIAGVLGEGLAAGEAVFGRAAAGAIGGTSQIAAKGMEALNKEIIATFGTAEGAQFMEFAKDFTQELLPSDTNFAPSSKAGMLGFIMDRLLDRVED